MILLYEGKNVLVNSTLKNNSLTPSFFCNLPFEKIKEDILGKNYELSIVLIGKKKGKTLNSKFRNKNYATDILSFSVSENSGEIFIVPVVARVKAGKFLDPEDKLHQKIISFEKYLLFLVIHGSLHLKGLEHGAKMDRYEFSHYSRYRRWHL